MKRKTSYTSADAIPAKLIRDPSVLLATEQKHIIPVHPQFIPTNYCNLSCDFCSCSEVDRTKQMSLDEAKYIIADLRSLGAKAVTITGGGEPFMHKNINEIIESFGEHNVKVGLVTNGLLLNRLTPEAAKYVTWTRISSGDDRDFSKEYEDMLDEIVNNYRNIDWAFSHVLSDKPNYDTIEKLQRFANAVDFTHVRYVADLFNPEGVDMEALKEEMDVRDVDDSLAIYQGRKHPRQGGDCYIGFLKPLISADSKVYACCGVQYALETPSKDLPEELCLGNARELHKIMQNSKTPLDGSICKRCYYTDYNKVLEILMDDLEHKEFL